MPSSRFVVSVADLENGPKEVSFTLSEAWLRDVLEPAGASPHGPGSVTVELTKQGREVMVRGQAHFVATLPCVVTLDPVDFDLRPEIFLMLQPGPAERRGAEGSGSKKHGGTEGSQEKKRPGSPNGAVPPTAASRPKRKKRSGAEDSELELSSEDSVRDTFQGDEIVLDDFVREFLLLELPLYPRRPDLPSPEESIVSRPLAGPTGEPSIDPRLAPLAKIAERLRGAGK